jgi:hypothetical protein
VAALRTLARLAPALVAAAALAGPARAEPPSPPHERAPAAAPARSLEARVSALRARLDATAGRLAAMRAAARAVRDAPAAPAPAARAE